MNEAKTKDKAALKQLRQERAAFIETAKAKIKSQNKVLRAIEARIKTEAKTIPEIASSMDMPTSLVLQYVSTMRKYGQVAEDEKDGDYFRYKLTN